MELLIPLIVLLVLIILAIYRKVQYNKLSQEDKDTYKKAVEKIGEINRKKKLFPVVGAVVFVVVLVLAIVISSMSQPKASQNDILYARSLIGCIWSTIFTATQLYIIGYVIARIAYEQLYIKKEIEKSNNLEDKEKALLLKHYITPMSKTILLGVLAEAIQSIIRLVCFTTADKPIIYIYPEEKQKVTIRVDKPENLIHAYPEYNDGWEVEADVDGTLTDLNGKKYYSLYWEGINKIRVNEKIGFCVKGEDTAKFLEEKLEELGLNYKEREEFIVYWLPQMENNRYNYIYFMQKSEVDTIMSLDINPKPESLIRIMMYFKPLLLETKVQEQVFKPVERNGYTVVEWGGTKIR